MLVKKFEGRKHLFVKRIFMSNMDKLSKWLRTAVAGGTFSSSNPAAARQGEPSQGAQGAQGPQPARPPFKQGLRQGVKFGAKPKPPFKQPEPKAKFVNRVAPDRGKLKTAPNSLRIIPIGGLEEVGKNSMVFEMNGDIIAVDMGFQFPGDDYLGVDYIIPDISYLAERKSRIKGIVITHAHLDHIGALPYVIADLGFPIIYGSKLTVGLIQKQFEEFKLNKKARFRVVDNQQTYQLGAFAVDFFRVNHSIPDSMGVRIKTAAGTVVHTGDFKFDFTPADGIEADIPKMTRMGEEGVDLLFSDSTNAMRPGHTISERTVAETLESLIKDTPGRIIIASFASLIGRIQQIVDFAQKNGRKVFLSGGSLEANAEIAHKLGFLNFHKDQLKSIREVTKFPESEVLILTTGGQGEPMAALSRMAGGAHAQVKIHEGDTVVVSSLPIIGNEKQVAFLIDSLVRRGAKVVNHQIMDVHTSGHGNQEDLKLMLNLMRPRNFAPVHGSYSMRKAHSELARTVGVPVEKIFVLDDGDALSVVGGSAGGSGSTVTAKKGVLKVGYMVVEGGQNRGDLGSMVLKEREIMAENGFVSVLIKVHAGRVMAAPLVSSRGFVYQKDLEKVLREIAVRARTSVEAFVAQEKRKLRESDFEARVRADVSGLIMQKMNRRPLVQINVVFV